MRYKMEERKIIQRLIYGTNLTETCDLFAEVYSEDFEELGKIWEIRSLNTDLLSWGAYEIWTKQGEDPPVLHSKILTHNYIEIYVRS